MLDEVGGRGLDQYGERYIKGHAFAAWVRENGLSSWTTSWDLNRYVDDGLLYPAIEVVAPPEVARDPYEYVGVPPEWETLWVAGGQDHPFDLLRATSPYLRDFDPTADYPVETVDVHGSTFEAPRVERYFAYWQVHQLYLITAEPVYTRFRHTVSRLRPDDQVAFRNQALTGETIRSVRGLDRGFDFLSRWITRYRLARADAVRALRDRDGLRRPSEVEVAAYEARIREATQQTLLEHGETAASLREFLHRLLELSGDYRRDQQEKLAQLVDRDVRHLTAIYWWAFGADELALHQSLNPWDRGGFEIAWPYLAHNEWARRTFAHFGERFRHEVAAFGIDFPESSVVDLVHFTFDEQLWEFIEGVGRLRWTDRDDDDYWLPAPRYRRARAAAAGLEFFLRRLIDRRRPDLARGLEGSTLGPLLSRIGGLAGAGPIKTRRLRTEGDWLDEFNEIVDQQSADWPGFVERRLRLALLARNLTTHRPLRDWDEEDHPRASGTLAEAVVFAAFITWCLLVRVA